MSIACAANELVRHRYIDQEIHEVSMFQKERARFAALRTVAERDADRLHIHRANLYTKIYRVYRAEMELDNYRKLQEAVGLREAESARCYSRAAKRE